MAEHRPFPPSPRRRALARQAGLHAASPLVVGAAAAAATLATLAMLGGATAHRLGAAIAAACGGRTELPPGAVTEAVLAIALPLTGAAAVTALVAQLAQTRAAWLPRRRIPGAPALEAGAGPRTARAAGALASGIAIAGVALVWLSWAAPHLAALVGLGPLTTPAAGGQSLTGTTALLVNLGAALVVAWSAIGVLHAVLGHAALSRALAMTSADKREDDRLSGADPRWRARRQALHRGPSASDAVAGASLILLGDDLAVAIAWDPVRRPIPLCTATGRGPRATQLVALARRHRIAIHRDAALAAALCDTDGPVPDSCWPRLAELVAATRARDRALP